MRPRFVLVVLLAALSASFAATFAGGGVVTAGAGAQGGTRATGPGKNMIRRIAGQGPSGYGGEGVPALKALFNHPNGIAVDGQGTVYIADTLNNEIRTIRRGVVRTISSAERDINGDEGVPAMHGRLKEPEGVAVDRQGTIYIADQRAPSVRVIRSGIIRTFAGRDDGKGFSGNGPAIDADVSYPKGLAVDGQGSVYITEDLGVRVDRVTNGILTRVAGKGPTLGDGGPAILARFNDPQSIAVDGKGNIYVGDYNRVRKIDTKGIITTFAGTGVSGLSGDGGPANKAKLYVVAGVAADTLGNVYIADHYRVRMVRPDGTITTFAGSGRDGGYRGAGNGGPARSAKLGPSAIALDTRGDLFLVHGNTIWEVIAPYATFLSPSRRISCAIVDDVARGSYVYCLSLDGPRSVRMTPDGRVTTCTGTQCADTAITGGGGPLGSGKKATIGRFRCVSQQASIKCTVIRTGQGFLIDAQGVHKIV